MEFEQKTPQTTVFTTVVYATIIVIIILIVLNYLKSQNNTNNILSNSEDSNPQINQTDKKIAENYEEIHEKHTTSKLQTIDDLLENDKPSIILFHADWCGHCKHFMPIWKELKSSELKNSIHFAEIDESQDLIQQQENIRGFPTIRIYYKNHPEKTKQYSGARDKSSVIAFIKSK